LVAGLDDEIDPKIKRRRVSHELRYFASFYLRSERTLALGRALGYCRYYPCGIMTITNNVTLWQRVTETFYSYSV
ncbi:hypothetical protein, partial [Aerococcus christensenii]|uniref:hypothetical protein n=1 Tax=Aerococcus christensenii TaxID=87541 RepID=UPI001E4CF603